MTNERFTVGDVDLTDAVRAWAVERYPPGSQVHDLARMPGNSGLSFSFSVTGPDREQLDALAMRFAPPGVRRSANTDVLRQVPLLRALSRCGIPVAEVRWSAAEDPRFGTDVLAQRLLSSRPLHLYDATVGVTMPADGADPLLRSAARVLADIHRLDWERELPGWSEPTGASAEVDRWWPLVGKAATPADAEAFARLRERLQSTAPNASPIGLYHGDFQTNNVLYTDDGTLEAVIDWEIAGVGLQGLDVAWLAMMTDPEPWGPEHRERLLIEARPDDVHRWYAEARGENLADFDWYRALADYRFAAICAFNLRLHRTGRRHDPFYETLASSVRPLVEHGLGLLG